MIPETVWRIDGSSADKCWHGPMVPRPTLRVCMIVCVCAWYVCVCLSCACVHGVRVSCACVCMNVCTCMVGACMSVCLCACMSACVHGGCVYESECVCAWVRTWCLCDTRMRRIHAWVFWGLVKHRYNIYIIYEKY